MVVLGVLFEIVWYLELGENEDFEGFVEIFVQVLIYDGVVGCMSYEKGVMVEQLGCLMVCDVMEVWLVESGEVDEMDCQGVMMLCDMFLQCVIMGDCVFYYVVVGEVEVFGDFFIFDDQVEQIKFQGLSFWYWFEDGVYGCQCLDGGG